MKSQSLTVRLAPDIKAALRQTAEHEHRSLANMLEVMIRAYARPHLSSGSKQHNSSGLGAVR